MAATKNPFTPVEDKLLSDLVAEGIKAPAIAKRLDRPESSVYRRIQTLGLAQGATRKTQRNCLCCSSSFLSDGPHNRLCSRCRRIETSPFHH